MNQTVSVKISMTVVGFHGDTSHARHCIVISKIPQADHTWRSLSPSMNTATNLQVNACLDSSATQRKVEE